MPSFFLAVLLFISAQCALAAVGECNISGNKLAGSFRATNISDVLKVYKAIRPKDEFETTSAYEARLQKGIASTANQLQCMLIEGDFSTKYDADNRRWIVGIYSPSFVINGRYPFAVTEEIILSGSYVASNAFGVTRQVAQTKHRKQGVTFPSRQFDQVMRALGAKKDLSEFLIPVPMQPDRARSVPKADLAVLIQYKWSPEYMTSNYEGHSPTINEPWKDETEFEQVVGKIVKVAVINRKTGDIFVSKSAP